MRGSSTVKVKREGTAGGERVAEGGGEAGAVGGAGAAGGEEKVIGFEQFVLGGGEG